MGQDESKGLSDKELANEIANSSMNLLLKSINQDRRDKNIRWLFLGMCMLIIAAVNYSNASKMFGGGFGSNIPEGEEYVALVRLEGQIGAGKTISAKVTLPGIEKAFEDKDARAVILLINSPGGSPAQSDLIRQRIVDLKAKHNKEVIVVAEDVLASGGFMIAMGADEIYLNQYTIAGSIGVIMNQWGLHEVAKKVGVEQRVWASGEHKNRASAFSPVSDEDNEKFSGNTKQMHKLFIKTVKNGRKGKLNGEDDVLFSGDFWIGQEAVNLG